MNLIYKIIKTMVRNIESNDSIKVFEFVNNDYFHIKFAITPLYDEDKESGEKKQTSMSMYTLIDYPLKPTAETVMRDILSSGDKASMQEIKEICVGLEVEPLEYMKSMMIEYITKYDLSDNVNSFKLNGASVWLDKATRVGLMNSTTIEKASGNETTTLWLGDVKLEINCDTAIQLLSALELYALNCFNVTAAHKKAVQELETVDEVLAYDYTKGYPDKLEMNV